MMTGIHLEEHAFLGIALPSGAVPGAAPLRSRRADARFSEDVGEGGAGQVDALSLGKQLSQVRVVHARIEPGRESPDTVAEFWCYRVSRDSSPVAVDHSPRPTFAIGRQEPPDLALAQAKEPGRSRQRQQACLQPDEHFDALFVVRRQDQSACLHGRT